jgi:cell division septal protein FtsQ
MALAATCSTLYVAQRKRLRGKRLLARSWLLGKCALLIALCVGLAWGGKMVYSLLLEAEYFRVQTVEIRGLTTLTREKVLYLLGLTKETTLWQLDLPRLGTRLTRHPYIKSVVLRREFPHTLRVRVQERTPYLVVSANNQHMLVDDEGVVLRAFLPEQDPKMPHILLPQPRVLEPGMRLRPQEVQRAFELIQTYQASPLAETLRLTSLTVQPSGISVWRFEQCPFDVRLGEEGITLQLGRLPFAVRYIAQQGLAVRAVDLSYRKRIVIVPTS